MMKNLRSEEENIIKDIGNLFGLKKDVWNLFRLENGTKAIKDEGVYCYKPVRVNNFWRNNYIEYESNGDRKKTLSVKEYLNEIRPFLYFTFIKIL